jgi:hypothetical protein
MKDQKIWIVIALLAVLVGGILVAFAKERFQVAPVSSQVENCPYCPQSPENNPQPLQPPENATVIPELGTIMFDLSVDPREAVLFKGQSLNITVTLYSHQEVNLSLAVGTGDDVPDLVLLGLEPELPLGFMATFSQNEIRMEANSTVITNLTLSISDEAITGTYTLEIFAVQKTRYGGHAVGVPLRLTIQ